MKKVYKKNLYDVYSLEKKEEAEVPVDGEIERGSRVFMMNCSSCHALSPGSGSGFTFGPSLGLIYNRRSGSDKEYEGYSAALANSNYFWTSSNLYKFMLNPTEFLPGTLCSVSPQKGLESEEDRADIIEFLSEYSKEMSKNIQIKTILAKGYGQNQTEIYAQRE